MTDKVKESTKQWFDQLLHRMERKRRRTRQLYRYMQKKTGRSIAQIEADLTRPDSYFEGDDD